ncbi:sigma factor-like helix-turn-helix DNA-binding protein [Kribbella sp. CA-293567]|uniref:sigma factor-like helix-turn-helix DNA-binding protein n=1 Tax=Kribbella sp. CA-293567 TaxID=3002436 RepID=UPI0022DE53A4|nr:sigma factor-like helix-turn-helix DNA-binding protein [Kribbella sp. CA-293567]WBQ07677.1 sigma factor-like helix-turn-helix DNA-binding protein [Kribbella sp. CA-293567]
MRDTVDPEFAAYVDARQGRWLRTAYLVYGDAGRAEEQLLRAFTRLSTRWGREDDPDSYVLGLLFHQALARWSRAKVFEDEEDPVKAALAALSPQQRAVLVLLYFEELTEFEAGEILGMSHSSVHTHSMTAVSRFRLELGTADWRDVTGREPR